MKRKSIIQILIVLLGLINMTMSYAFWASSIDGDTQNSDASVTIGTWNYETVLSIFTDFEDVSKGSYALGDITTYGYTWTLDDALIGTLSSDLKNDLKSVRLRNGVLQTTFAIENIKNISFVSGRFGSDSLSNLYIDLSLDQSNWLTYESIFITENLTSYQITFTNTQLDTLGLSSEDMLYLRFRSDNSSRINVDDVNIGYTQIIEESFSFFEDFESASKTAYAVDTIDINGLNWILDEALIGTLSADQKNDSRSVRIRNGHISTLFKVENIVEISFYVGNYNQGAPSVDFDLSFSTDGINWSIIDTFSSTASFDLYQITITNTLLSPLGLNTTDAVYIRISTNTSTRINVDDLTITYTGIDSFDVD